MSRKSRNRIPVAEYDSSESESGDFSRRKLMAAGAATWATASIAGCGGQTEETTTSTQTTTTATPTTAEPQPENFVVTDQLAASHTFGVGFTDDCMPTRALTVGMLAMWDIQVYDAANGDTIGTDTLDAVTLNIDGGPSLDASWAGDAEEHPAPIWEVRWEVPESMSTGEYEYTIEVTGGDDANFTTVGLSTGTFSVVEDTMPDYYLSTETYSSSGPDDLPEESNGFVGSCAPERQFLPSMNPTFYVQIYESETGLLVGTEADGNATVNEASEEPVISSNTVEGVTVRFPDTDEFADLQLEWIHGAEDDHTAPHWEAEMTEPETLPAGEWTWEVDIAGVDAADTKIVGAASDVFTVLDR